jgi:hypothetical protein
MHKKNFYNIMRGCMQKRIPLICEIHVIYADTLND